MGCGYRIGKLRNFVYLVEDLVYKQSDYKVEIISGKITKVYADLVTLTESESFLGRFKFATSVVCTFNKLINDSIFRSKLYNIIVEDRQGLQFLVNPEFLATYTSEINIEEFINYLVTFRTESNIPTKIITNKVGDNVKEIEFCGYDNTKITKLFIKDNGEYKEIECYAKTYSKTFDGDYENVQISFSLPVYDNNYHYDLIKFADNRHTIKLEIGSETIEELNMFPSYTRLTAEEGGLDKFVFIFKSLTNGTPIEISNENILFEWRTIEGAYICDGVNKYVKEQLYEFSNNQWIAQDKFRKGILLEINSKDCGYEGLTLYKWVPIDNPAVFVCKGFDKYNKQQKYQSTDGGITWQPLEEFRDGTLIEVNSVECGYEKIEWLPVEGEYICDEYDPTAVWILSEDEYICDVIA